MPPCRRLEKNVDKQLIAFIDDNIQQTVAESEDFLDRTLDAALVQRMGDELWESLSSTTLARLTRTLDKHAVTAGSDVIQEIWQHLRTTAIAEDILEAVVRSFFCAMASRTSVRCSNSWVWARRSPSRNSWRWLPRWSSRHVPVGTWKHAFVPASRRFTTSISLPPTAHQKTAQK